MNRVISYARREGRGPSLADLHHLAGQMNATIAVHLDREGLEHELVAEAPDGKIFTASGTHGLVSAGDHGTPLDTLVADMHERLSHGVEPCDVEDCDTCADGGAR